MKQRIEQWLLMLSPREKLMVFGGVGIALFIILWGGLWEPLSSHQRALEKQVAERANELRWMQKAQQKIQQARSNPQTRRPKVRANPSQIIETTLQRYQLKKGLKQMRGNKEVSISLKDVNADQVFRFLGELETRYGLQILSMNIIPLNSDAKKAKGRVNVSIKLARIKQGEAL